MFVWLILIDLAIILSLHINCGTSLSFSVTQEQKKSIPYIREPRKSAVTNFSVMIQIINNVIVRLSDKV